MTLRLSIIILTLDEADHIPRCLDALANQDVGGFEVVVVDAASTDGTVSILEDAHAWFPAPLTVEAADRRLSVGEARNRGVELAKAPNIAFLSADTQARPDWVQQVLESLERADIVYGRQVHTPCEDTLAAAVRGLRYHFPEEETTQPARYASHANAALRREIPLRHPFGSTVEAGAVDDLLLTQKAANDGYAIAYNPEMVVAHDDVTTFRQELNKNLREAAGWGKHPDLLGYHWPFLDWGMLLLTGLILTAWFPHPVTFALLLGFLWFPAARRVTRRWRQMPPRELLKGFLASPLFDLAFLARYLQALIRETAATTTDDPTEGTHP